MDANNIKYIVAIAKYGSINHAAKAMFISQPQLSHILKTTEEECGLTLFQRTSRGTKLTPEGEDYLHHCNIILAEMAKLNRYVTQAASAQSRLQCAGGYRGGQIEYRCASLLNDQREHVPAKLCG